MNLNFDIDYIPAFLRPLNILITTKWSAEIQMQVLVAQCLLETFQMVLGLYLQILFYLSSYIENSRAYFIAFYFLCISYSFSVDDVRRLFDRYGRVYDVTLPLDYFTGHIKGYAFVEYPFWGFSISSIHVIQIKQSQIQRLKNTTFQSTGLTMR